MDRGFVFVGSNAYRVSEILSVAGLTSELAEGYRERARATIAASLEDAVKRIKVLWRKYQRIGPRKSRRIPERLQELQHQITEALVESWEILTGRLSEKA